MGKLTAKFVENAPPGMHSDGGGLYLQAGAGGAKSWVFRFKLNGKQRYMGLGSATVVSLKKARELADAARLNRSQGVDPIDHQERVRAIAAAAKVALAAKTVIFKDYAERYIAGHEAAWKNAIHRQQWRNTIRDYANPIIGHLPLSEIDTDAVMRVLEPIWDVKHETASRVRQRIESILDAAKVLKLRDGENPARWRGHLSELLPSKRALRKVKPVKHHAAIPWKQMPSFMNDLRSRPSLSARALEFITLTAARASEACGARWEEIDLAEAVWTIPGLRMKNGKAHKVPLVGRALEILQAYSDTQRFGPVFPGYKGKSITIAAPGKMLEMMGRTETTHGMRSSFRDWAAEKTDFPDYIVEKALAHTIPSAVEAAYRRGDLLEKRRELMAEWDQYLERTQ